MLEKSFGGVSLAIFVDKETKLVVQGVTGRDGSFHTKQMLSYGTKVVAGVSPGKKGTMVETVPVFNSVLEAKEATGANTSIIYVPVAAAADAVFEAIYAGIDLVVIVTEGIPVHDAIKFYHAAQEAGVRLIGPNCPGLISPGKCKVGILPASIFLPGNVGVVSRSGTLTYEVVWQLTSAQMGQSTCVGIGGDPVIGTNFIDCLMSFQDDPETEAIVLIGEIGGTDEQDAADFVKAYVTKPVVSFIAGATAPPGKRMGHAGAIISRGSGTAEEKKKALFAAGVGVADIPAQIPELMKIGLKSR
jgi:succinyl-CoA synthetase alpha subunit